jgi:hypothetical protein
MMLPCQPRAAVCSSNVLKTASLERAERWIDPAAAFMTWSKLAFWSVWDVFLGVDAVLFIFDEYTTDRVFPCLQMGMTIILLLTI